MRKDAAKEMYYCSSDVVLQFGMVVFKNREGLVLKTGTARLHTHVPAITRVPRHAAALLCLVVSGPGKCLLSSYGGRKC